MANWDEINKDVDAFAERISRELVEFQVEIGRRVEDAKRDEIIDTLAKVNARLTAIEAKLVDNGEAQQVAKKSV